MELLKLCNGLEDQLADGSDDVVTLIADMVSDGLRLNSNHDLSSTQLQKGAHGSRADDTKNMKGPVLDWLAVGEPLVPPLHRRDKSLRGFNHPRTGALLCPAGLDWNAQGYSPRSTLIYIGRLFSHSIQGKLQSGELHVRGDQWPSFLYTTYKPEQPWSSLLRNPLLVTVRYGSLGLR